MNAAGKAIEPRRGVDVRRGVVPVRVSNSGDLSRAERDELAAGEIRSETIDALVDTGATFLCLPQPMIDRLGLEFNRDRMTKTFSGIVSMRMYRGCRIEVQGRACSVEVMAVPEARRLRLHP